MNNTLDYYDRNAQLYAERTVNLDMAPIRGEFAQGLRAGAKVLDVGCGSGRDAKAFHDEGFDVTAFDGSAELAGFARRHTGLPVQHLRYDQMGWRDDFEGAWACSSLVHLSDAELMATLQRIRRASKVGAVFFTCFKQGEQSFTDGEGRFFNAFTEERLRRVMDEAGFDVSRMWLTGHLAEPHTLWVNVIARRPADAC